MIQQDCSEPYRIYTHPELCNASPDGCLYLSQRVVDCILDRIPQGVLADTAAAAVLHGLLPTVLSFAASSTNEVALLASRRPILAFILAAASPATTPLRSADYRGTVRTLSKYDEYGSLFSVPAKWHGALSFVQYLIAMANVANLVTTLAELSIKSVCSVSVPVPYLLGIWAMVGLLQYVLGALCFRMAVTISIDDDDQATDKPGSLLSFPGRETKPCGAHRQLHLSCRKASHAFVFPEWFTSVLIICNIINGTVHFASILFVGARDAVPIAARLLASALVSRVVLVYELAGLRQNLAGRHDHINGTGTGTQVIQSHMQQRSHTR